MKEEEEEEKFLGLLAWSAGPEGPDALRLTLDLRLGTRTWTYKVGFEP